MESDEQPTQQKARLEQVVLDLRGQLEVKEQEVHRLTARLEEIEGSRAWKLVGVLWRLRLALFPHGSPQERLASSLLRSWQRKPEAQGASVQEEAPVTENEVVAPPRTSRYAALRSPLEDSAENRSEPDWPVDRFPWPLISVLLPVYNQAEMLLESARSVLNSTYPHLELIILDDGSTDTVLDSLEELNDDPRVRVYRQPNQQCHKFRG